MYNKNERKKLCGLGKKLLNSNLEDSIIKYLPNFNKITPFDKLFALVSNKYKQKIYKDIIYKEIFFLQIEFNHKKEQIISILNNGDIYKLRIYIQSNKELPAYISYTLDYLIDEYKIDIFNGKEDIDFEEISIALVLIYFKEVIFYILLEKTTILKNGNVLTILPSYKFEDEFKRRWMAISWDKTSFHYDQIKNTKRSMIQKIVNIDTYVFKEANLLFDKAFYINKKYINKNHFKLADMQYMYNICVFFSYLLYGFYYRKKIKTTDKRFIQLGLNMQFISNMIDTNKSKVNLNKGFIVNKNNISFIDGSAPEYIIRMYFDDYLKAKKKNKFNTIKGHIFEEYIFNYIKRQPNSFKTYDICIFDKTFEDVIDGKKVKLDIDLILFDKSRKKYFLIQAKHATYAKAYLKEEIHHFCNNSELLEGIEQINSFNYFYNKDDSLKLEFEKKGITGLIEENTHLLLIHTMPVFDFLKIKNVTLYDWNSFRNILQYGLRHTTAQNLHDDDFIIQTKNILEIEDVKKTMNQLLDTTIIDKDNNTTLQDEFKYFKHTSNYIQTLNYKIETTIK